MPTISAPHTLSLQTLVPTFLLAITGAVLGCGKSGVGHSADMEVEEWILFVPPESADAGCRLERNTVVGPSHQRGLMMISDRLARYGIKPKNDIIKVHAGERYRMRAWVKLAPEARAEPGSPGVLLRATLFEERNKNYSRGHLYAARAGVVLGDVNLLPADVLPRDWTKLEAVIEIPPGVAEMKFFVFTWWAAGEVWVDDASIERVAADTLLTPRLDHPTPSL